MKKIVIIPILLLMICLANVAFAQNNDEGEQVENCLLWKITNSVGVPSYLFAYVPNLCEADKILSEGTQEALYDSQEILFDIDLMDANDKKMFDHNLQLSAKKKLKSFFENENEYKEILKKLKAKLGDDFADGVNLKSWALADLIEKKNVVCEHKYDYRQDFMKVAEEIKIPISIIESTKDYANMMDKLCDKKEKLIILEAINSDNSTKILNAFGKKDLKGLAAMKQAKIIFKDNANDYFYYRNKKLAASLKPKINLKSVFAVVDAASVGGENGLLMMLLQEGFSIEPMLR
jgi:uncharacterized protein